MNSVIVCRKCHRVIEPEQRLTTNERGDPIHMGSCPEARPERMTKPMWDSIAEVIKAYDSGATMDILVAVRELKDTVEQEYGGN